MPSIKDHEHKLRHGFSSNFQIFGRKQSRPSNFHDELRNDKFKMAVAQFFIKDWSRDDQSELIGNKKIYVSHEKAHSITSYNNKVTIVDVPHLTTGHFEADTKISLHVCNMYEKALDSSTGVYAYVPSNIRIRASDCDILIILLGNLHRMVAKDNHIWLDCGTGKNRRLIDVSNMYKSLGPDICKALPAFHAFTGCDFNSAFFLKGKKIPLNILMSNPIFIKAFAGLGDISIFYGVSYEDLKDMDIFKTIQQYVCFLYRHKKSMDLNDIRYQIFRKTFKIKGVDDYINIDVKTFDASALPPCTAEFAKHFLRSAYIAWIWTSAYDPNFELEEYSATSFGWKAVFENGQESYDFDWHFGDRLPILNNIIIEDLSAPNDGKFLIIIFL